MVAKRNKEVKEQRRPTVPHLELHRAAALKGAAAADDEREVVGPELGVGVGGVGVGVAGGGENGAALDAGFYKDPLLEQLASTNTDMAGRTGRIGSTYGDPASAAKSSSDPQAHTSPPHNK